MANAPAGRGASASPRRHGERVSDNPYALLISHAERWAAKTKRPLDAGLLSTALNLRDFQDRVPGTQWSTVDDGAMAEARAARCARRRCARRHARQLLAVLACNGATGLGFGRTQGFGSQRPPGERADARKLRKPGGVRHQQGAPFVRRGDRHLAGRRGDVRGVAGPFGADQGCVERAAGG